MHLHNWQSECLEIWERNGFRGIVNAVTGSGKTVFALAALEHLSERETRELRVKIVVPQTFLASQWKDEIRRQIGAPASDIGTFSGKQKDHDRKYMVYVINSARYSLARHIMSDLNRGYAVLLIADECHHYGSVENNRIFDFYKIMQTNSPYYALGLSATPEIVDFRAISVPLGNEIYSYDLKNALHDRVISRFILFSVKLSFTQEECMEYDSYSAELFKGLSILRKKRPELIGLHSGLFFSKLQKFAKQGDDCAQLSQIVLTLMYKRRTLCHMASERPHCAISIIKALPIQSRVILFCERIQAAEQLHCMLEELFHGQVGLYHSQMAHNIKQNMLERYKHGAIRLLVCCKALDEGLNIPSTDAGIIVSASLSARQRVQRIGRMLRHSKDIKRIYFLHIAQSNEDTELSLGVNALGNSVPYVALKYDDMKFFHSEYERLRKDVVRYVTQRRQDAQLIGALNQNIDFALLRGDFLVRKDTCMENIRSSKTTAERNYWVSVLYVIHARLGRL